MTKIGRQWRRKLTRRDNENLKSRFKELSKKQGNETNMKGELKRGLEEARREIEQR